MGLTRIDESEWLVTDDRRDQELGLKRRLLREHRDDVLLTLPDLQPAPACAELQRMLDENGRYSARFSPEFDRDGDWSDPLVRAALSVQEDLCVLLPDATGQLVLAAACVCFPSHWRLADKMGTPAGAIHEPVPRYDDELAKKVDTFLDRLRPPAVMKRRNWTIHESADLFVPHSPAHADVTIPPEDLWLRSERQTLRRLSESSAVVFTIRTQQVQIRALRHRPDIAGKLADRLSAQPGDRAQYAGYSAHVPALVHRLTQWRS
jgi:heme-dependent oxidative N-demethylase alpha subunit-like protein